MGTKSSLVPYNASRAGRLSPFFVCASCGRLVPTCRAQLMPVREDLRRRHGFPKRNNPIEHPARSGRSHRENHPDSRLSNPRTGADLSHDHNHLRRRRSRRLDDGFEQSGQRQNASRRLKSLRGPIEQLPRRLSIKKLLAHQRNCQARDREPDQASDKSDGPGDRDTASIRHGNSEFVCAIADDDERQCLLHFPDSRSFSRLHWMTTGRTRFRGGRDFRAAFRAGDKSHERASRALWKRAEPRAPQNPAQTWWLAEARNAKEKGRKSCKGFQTPLMSQQARRGSAPPTPHDAGTLAVFLVCPGVEIRDTLKPQSDPDGT
jgi:hypothetical protein